MSTHEFYMKRCIQLAKNGLGTTYPNPMVGSVIVHDNKIIGEGWHKKAGEPHAEVNAIHSVKDKTLLSKATIYVSLEPCSHFGKTPPCSDLIVSHKIPNVVIGTIDPFAKVAGNGIKKLRENNCHVTLGILEKECNELNKRFFTFHQKKRPYIILKWAASKDGFLAPDKSERATAHKALQPIWITNTYSRQLVHKWRTEEEAILVGTQTVLDDNPKLNARDFSGQNPIRLIIDKSNKISEDFAVKSNELKTYFFTENNILTKKENIIYENIVFDTNFLLNLTNRLYKKEIQSVIIEGGLKTLQSFIDLNLWDEARVFEGNTVLNSGIKAPVLNSISTKTMNIMDDTLKIFRNYD
ncbi:Diaminohydroxyphosphoribosylaminopyrimidine deaminase / 5-amino-6-(5-phosphoribosylamino)uracil reductase [Flavobacterium sp. 9AF]|uniref:bifunctional diaminohydroxyphosphoribosylaminopyrimidine deaminase/5-amino-6-(5-phosphoribosylamino)uracil reductase RibD n=1 Tax=Flavobacterium sp. 9AF TaxID=2653142 RepID=UPI0012F3ED67|nr:bifunctional diaminohydroxyphosphoribosylaminopyrimidine deaminase/5-amino-6-(5-phosphoribosylamino)uracil reductase RibD [Flavobacterium sp. 9AF]VXC23491.1 Diaminohydroxyphosphoribosylaminopyrimidine deaminase / 5-amino-6-(5-phosphoribosylamino)uracil reductase [Flavobacterium sp. 9AF]